MISAFSSVKFFGEATETRKTKARRTKGRCYKSAQDEKGHQTNKIGRWSFTRKVWKVWYVR